MSSKANILIIEDDKDMVEALRIILEGRAYKVKVALNGKQGFDAIHKERPDLIILDLLLPDEDGANICRNVKNNPEYRDIPVLVLTALAKKMENKIFSKSEGRALEAEEYLDKPIDPEKLLNKVRKLINK